MRKIIREWLCTSNQGGIALLLYLLNIVRNKRKYLFLIKTEALFVSVNGDKQWISCKDLTKEEIIKWMELIRTQAGNTTGMRYRKLLHTDFPSIQGPWTPYTFRDPALNLAEFPSEELSRPAVLPKTATESLVEIFKKQKLESLDKKRAE